MLHTRFAMVIARPPRSSPRTLTSPVCTPSRNVSPTRSVREPLEWVAHSFLATTPLDEVAQLKARRVVPLVGFSWGFTDTGTSVTVDDIEVLTGHEWNRHLDLLREGYPMSVSQRQSRISTAPIHRSQQESAPVRREGGAVRTPFGSVTPRCLVLCGRSSLTRANPSDPRRPNQRLSSAQPFSAALITDLGLRSSSRPQEVAPCKTS